MEILKKEVGYFLDGLKKARLQKFTFQSVFREMIANGVAALIAFFVYTFLRSLFTVDSNLKYGIKKTFTPKKIEAMEISEKEFNWIMDWFGVPVIFIVSIVVFSLVEQVMEHYLAARSGKQEQ